MRKVEADILDKVLRSVIGAYRQADGLAYIVASTLNPVGGPRHRPCPAQGITPGTGDKPSLPPWDCGVKMAIWLASICGPE